MRLPRLQAFELNDQRWFPRVLRDMITDSLDFSARVFKFYDAAAPVLRRLLDDVASDRVVDLCSGSAGPMAALRGTIARSHDVQVTLTDISPNRAAADRVAALGDPSIHYMTTSVDATSVPRELAGVRTLFTSFHHFAPATARAILADAVRAGAPIAIFEVTERSLPALLISFTVPFGMLVMTPFIRPRTLARFAFTYLIPIAPLANLWDGLVSCMRTYTPDELAALAASTGDSFVWEAGRLRQARGPALTYLIGRPRDPERVIPLRPSRPAG
jgi:hypothetical protein